MGISRDLVDAIEWGSVDGVPPLAPLRSALGALPDLAQGVTERIVGGMLGALEAEGGGGA